MDMAPVPVDIKFAPLLTYILRAEALEIINPPKRLQPLFKPAPHVSPPTLRSDRENRILVYPGCFNPPHHGHTALLWHTFLCCDSHTIAALIVPIDDFCVASKASTSGSGRSFRLTHYQRSQLWKDNVLNRFTWTYPGDLHDYTEFREKVVELAAKDGFKINFVTCYGSDHFEREKAPSSRSVVGSDVTRARGFVRDGGERMSRLRECRPWKKMAGMREILYQDPGEKPECWPCWACCKMRSVVLEFFDERVDHRKSVLEGWEDEASTDEYYTDSLTVGGDLKAILQRCHDSKGVIWWCKKTDPSLDGSYYALFIPSGRTYSSSSSSSSQIGTSATAIRD
jgi:hypothetical protein